jgi:hypothetical protein
MQPTPTSSESNSNSMSISSVSILSSPTRRLSFVSTIASEQLSQDLNNSNTSNECVQNNKPSNHSSFISFSQPTSTS